MNTHTAATAYATTAPAIASAVNAAGARSNSAGKYPTKPAGITVNRIQRIGPVKSVSGYSENMSVTSYNCRLTDSVRPSQNAALCIATAVESSTAAPATPAASTSGTPSSVT